MDEREPIQVSLRLPAGTLEGLNRLVEQLRLLAAEVNGGVESPAVPPAEAGYNDGFDAQRFELLRTEPEDTQTAQTEFSGVEDVQTVPGEAARLVEEPAGASDGAEIYAAGTRETPETKAGASDADVPERPEEEAVPWEPREESAAVRTETEDTVEEAAAVHAEAESPVEGARAVRMEPESQIPAAEAVWTERGGETPDAQTVRVDAFSEGAQIQSAGSALGAIPEAISGKWNSVTQELDREGPAPLTAEAVSLAFRRDGRRYDNGFPLY